MVIALTFFKRIVTPSLPMNQAHSLIIAEVYGPVAPARTRPSRGQGSPQGDARRAEASRTSGIHGTAAARFGGTIDQRPARGASSAKLFRGAVGNTALREVDETTTDSTTFYRCGAVPHVRLQLVLGDDRAEVSLDNLQRLLNRPLCEQLGVILRALTVVAATRILGWKMTDGIPTPAAGCGGIAVDGRCQLVVATVVHVAKAVEMSVLRLDEPEPRVPKASRPSSAPRTAAGRPSEGCPLQSPPAHENARQRPRNREQARNQV